MYPRVQRPSFMCYQLVAQSVETIKRINPRLKLECTRSGKPTNNRSNNKYQLPLSDPHDRIVDRARRSAQQTTVVEHRSSEVLSTQLTDDGPVYYALSVHLSRAKLITRFDDQYAAANFSTSRDWSRTSISKTITKRLHTLTTWHCPHSSTAAAERQPCSNRSTSAARQGPQQQTCNSGLAAVAVRLCGTDRQTDAVTLDRPYSTYCAVSANTQLSVSTCCMQPAINIHVRFTGMLSVIGNNSLDVLFSHSQLKTRTVTSQQTAILENHRQHKQQSILL